MEVKKYKNEVNSVENNQILYNILEKKLPQVHKNVITKATVRGKSSFQLQCTNHTKNDTKSIEKIYCKMTKL